MNQPFVPHLIGGDKRVAMGGSPNFRKAAIVPKYSPLLYSLLFLLMIDFLINAFSGFAVNQWIALLVIYLYASI
jgi:hypothetical protein